MLSWSLGCLYSHFIRNKKTQLFLVLGKQKVRITLASGVTKKYVHECIKYQLNLLKLYKFLEPKWLDSPKKSEQARKIWSYSSGFAQKKVCVQPRWFCTNSNINTRVFRPNFICSNFTMGDAPIENFYENGEFGREHVRRFNTEAVYYNPTGSKCGQFSCHWNRRNFWSNTPASTAACSANRLHWCGAEPHDMSLSSRVLVPFIHASQMSGDKVLSVIY